MIGRRGESGAPESKARFGGLPDLHCNALFLGGENLMMTTRGNGLWSYLLVASVLFLASGTGPHAGLVPPFGAPDRRSGVPPEFVPRHRRCGLHPG